MEWKTAGRVALRGISVGLSEPVLVKRSRWYCWFPALIRQPDGALWAVMSATADIHFSGSTNYLSRSTDGGLTWDESRVIGDAGLSHVALDDGRAVILPYYMRPRAGGAIGAPCNVIAPGPQAGWHAQVTMRPSGVTVSGWPRPPTNLDTHLGIASFVFNGEVVRGRGGEYLTTLYGNFAGEKRYTLVLAESADGFDWRIRSIIAGADCALPGKEGPCESALCRLEDGRLMNVFRLESFLPYGQAFSADDGRTWTAPTAMSAASVEPSLAVMPGGVVALSGGRPGIFVWFSVGGNPADWQPVDIVAHHNSCRPRDPIDPDSRKCWLSPDDMRRQGLAGVSSNYTQLARLDECHLLLIYDRLGFGWHPIPDGLDAANSIWVMRLEMAP